MVCAARARFGRLVVASAVVVICALITIPAAWAGAPAGATTPPNARAYIFDALGAHPASLAAELRIKGWLEQDHYRVKMWSDPEEGNNPFNRHGITLDNFAAMAGAGIVIINGHGSGSNGIPAETFPSTVLGGGAYAVAMHHYLAGEHWSGSWIRTGSGPFGTQLSLGFTPAGIAHFFRGEHTGLIYTSGCGSASLAPQFNAQAFFGYAGETCSSQPAAAGDMGLFFERLAGFRGTDERDTSSAAHAGGYSTGAGIESGSGPGLHGAVPLTLAPAITRVSPRNGSTILPGPRDASVRFDTVMDEHGGSALVKASGCSAKARAEKWRTPQLLDFVLDVPKRASGCKITLTARASKARADPKAGWPAELDGNQDPSPQNGAVPNGTDYQWTVNVGGRRKHGKPPPPIPKCPTLHVKQLCFVFDGSISAQGIDKSVNSNSYAGTMTAHIVWLITYPGAHLQGGSELMEGADPALSSASGSTDFSSPFAVCGQVLSYRAAVTAGIPLSDGNSSDGNGHWTVHVPSVLFGSAPDGSFPANGTCTNPIQPTDPPYDGAALYTFRERGATGDGFEFINFHFSTHQRTTTVRYPRVSRTETDSFGSTSTVAWSGTITAVMGPGVS